MNAWTRPILDRATPERGAGGFYRASSDHRGHAGGVPLTSANAAMVAAVRLAYDVADAQIERSNRLARRLRGAGDSIVGPNSDTQALDGAERLITNAVLSGLEWWETSVAQGRCPTTRLIGAEYRLLGKILGFDAPSPVPPAAGPPSAPSPPAPDAVGQPAVQPGPPASAAGPPQWDLVIAHLSVPEERRAVSESTLKLTADGDPVAELYFFASAHADLKRMAEVKLDDRTLLLKIKTKDWPPGHWRAAVCNTDNVQLGVIEIVL